MWVSEREGYNKYIRKGFERIWPLYTILYT